ncbi:hypothetical protein [Pseudomonas sp. UMAB-40]|uniref:hypothetical protein n=1 Tax=Pseudomonas sp. UMAB-40 TaxID=1365407 RepID=UPI001C563647|nr:hypothetical protein [Pseudomonas sp. UMAB-40]
METRKSWTKYEVRGISNSDDFPYRNDLSTLKQAVEIAKAYPGIYQDGAATHIVRYHSKRGEQGSGVHHTGGITHRWRVFANGRLELLRAYAWPFARKTISVDQWLQFIPKAEENIMIHPIPSQEENNTEKYPAILTFDKGSVWLKRRGKPARKITVLAWTVIAAALLILFNPF